MRGSLSLDLIVAFIVLLSLASVILSYSNVVRENIVRHQYQIAADAQATAVGSAVNRFISSDPDSGILNVTLHNVGESHPFLDIVVDSFNCTYTVGIHSFTVNYTYHFIGSNEFDHVGSSYPIIPSVSTSSLQPEPCNVTFAVNKTGTSFKWVVYK